MKTASRLLCCLMLFGLSAAVVQPAAAEDAEKGFVSIFDGKTLKGWDGDPKFWSVKDGAITGQTTKENPTKGNTFIVWKGGDVGDFELKLEYRIIPNNDRGFANSGIQYRSFKLKGPDRWRIGGYQADFEAGKTYSGILYGEKYRGILCKRGQETELTRNDAGKFAVKVVGKVGDSDAIQSKIKDKDWNSYHIIADGIVLTHKINGMVTAKCTDNDVKERRAKGLLALQLHAGPPMTVQFRNIRIKRSGKTSDRKGAFRFRLNVPGVRVQIDGKKVEVLAPGTRVRVDRKETVERTGERRIVVDRFGRRRIEVVVPKNGGERGAKATETREVVLGKPAALAAEKQKTRKIVFIAGRPSHGYGAHEHKAGCMLLAKALNESGLPVHCEVVTGGWPKDSSILQDADSIVIYADGGGGHPFNRHIEELDKLMKKGVGMVCIHYGVEVPKGKSGNAFLDWTGGYFETNWSVNPHWTAKYEKFPNHPISNGVKPFTIRDEWYYHMRFRPKMAGVTPILTDLPPASTLVKPDGSLARPDNAHNNNPKVREAVLKRKEAQHMAWATERKDGGRGFGFTGGHDHWNWGNNQFRKLVLNAIAWTAHIEVPKDGVPSKTLTVKDLMANQDYKPRGNFNPARIQKMLDDWNRESEGK